MRMMLRLAGGCALAALAAAPMAARGGDAAAVQQAVEQFLQHLGDGEFEKLADDFAPKAIVIVTREREGKWSNNYQSGEDWVGGLKKNPGFTKFREPIANVKTTVDSDALAYLRADFQVVRDGRTMSHGVDQFTLVREGGRWKVAAIAYTSIPNR